MGAVAYSASADAASMADIFQIVAAALQCGSGWAIER